VDTEKKKTSDLQREFELHKIVVRNRDSAGAKYKLQLLGRVRQSEKERDDVYIKLSQLQREYDRLHGSHIHVQEELDKEMLKMR